MLIFALTAALSGCGSGGTRIEGPRPRSNVVSILQEDSLLTTAPAGFIGAARRLGFTAVRTNVFWSHIAPDATSGTRPGFDAADPSAYPAAGWSAYDAADRAAARDHVVLYLTITGPGPVWAAGAGMPHTRNCPCGQWEPSPSAFAAFVHAVGVRYSGRYTPPGASTPLPRVSFWSIWNEPNYGPNLAPQATDHSAVEVSPRLYRSLLRAGWSSLLATGHAPSRDTILIGETAPRGVPGPGDFNGLVPLRFIRALYCIDGRFRPLRGTAAALRGCPTTATGAAGFVRQNPALFDASGWADHPYPDQLGPTVRTPPPIGTDYADFAALPELERTLDRAAAAYGRHPRLPIYSTEFGYRTDPPNREFGVPLASAASYLNEAEYLTWRNPRLRSYDQYLLIDPPPTGHSQFDTGLRFFDGRPKPIVYGAFRMPIWLPRTRGRRLEVWGCARAAAVGAAALRPQRVVLEFARPGGRFRPVRTVALTRRGGCYYDVTVTVPGRGSIRAAWAGDGAHQHSRVQPVS